MTPEVPMFPCSECGHMWNPEPNKLFCRRFPPAVLPHKIKHKMKDANGRPVKDEFGKVVTQEETVPLASYPPVRGIWTCGEWKSKIMLAKQ